MTYMGQYVNILPITTMNLWIGALLFLSMPYPLSDKDHRACQEND